MQEPKYLRAAELIMERARRGDYALKGVPTEQQLSRETGVSRMTLRKAVQYLVDQGVMQRLENGRIAVQRGGSGVAGHRQVAFLGPAYPSPDVDAWRHAVERVASAMSIVVRPVDYVHADDPVIADALRAFDGVFIAPSGAPLPDLRGAAHPVVVLNWDMSATGIPSINLFPPVFVHKLLEHLQSLGHQHIDCFNAQPLDIDIEQRIGCWREWTAAQGMAGELVNSPVQAYEPVVEHAYRVMHRRLAGGPGPATALLCTTMPAAIGTLRALHELHVVPGVDLSVCVVNDEDLGRFTVPSLTHLLRPDPVPHLRTCLEWMIERGGRDWTGPTCLQPTRVKLFKGESTGPCVNRTAPPKPARR